MRRGWRGHLVPLHSLQHRLLSLLSPGPSTRNFVGQQFGTMATVNAATTRDAPETGSAGPRATTGTKLHGRAFYESLGSPKYVLAPMVDQSEFAWRMLTRSFLSDEEKKNMLAYTPMLHARLFSQTPNYRKVHFQAVKPDSDSDSNEPWLDGNPALDRPLFVQFCANDPEALLSAAQQVAPYCDAVDLNLGCPQGIARKGHYGAFLQEDQDLIFRLVNILHKELPIPVTAKIRILETKEDTLAYAQNVLKAGASILTVHGRRRDQKGHLTGLADWKMLRFLRDSLPPETVLFANGNILQGSDMEACLAATGADGIMSAEGNLSDPALFATPPPPGQEGREYWRGKDGKGGWRVDAIMRRYMDIVHKYARGIDPPERRPLFLPGDDTAWMETENQPASTESEEPAKKRRKKDKDAGKREEPSPNLSAMQPHLFHLLRHLVSKHTDVRDMLARSARSGIEGFERVMQVVELKVAQGLLEYEATGGKSFEDELVALGDPQDEEGLEEGESSKATIRKCKRPWWVAQPIIRPLPKEALAKGAIRPSKKELKSGGKMPVQMKGEAKGEEGEVKAQSRGKRSRSVVSDGADETTGRSTGNGTGVDVEEEEREMEKEKEIESRDELVSG